MKPIKIIEILLLALSMVSYIGSHLIVVLAKYASSFIWFGIPMSKSLVIDICLIFAIGIPLVIIFIILIGERNG